VKVSFVSSHIIGAIGVVYPGVVIDGSFKGSCGDVRTMVSRRLRQSGNAEVRHSGVKSQSNRCLKVSETRITRATDSWKRWHVTCPDPTVPLDRTKTSDLPGGYFLMKIHLLMYNCDDLNRPAH
jgi:hypothetical protein